MADGFLGRWSQRHADDLHVAVHTALSVHASDAIMIVTKKGTMIRMPVDGVRITGRSAQGVKLIDLDDDDVVMSATPVEPEDEEAPAEAGAAPGNPADAP